MIAKQSVSAINIPVMNQCDQKSLEDKETDAFLDEVHKRKVSDEIKQRNKKLQAQESLPIPPEEKRPQVDSITQLCNSATSETSAMNILLVDQKLLDSNSKKGSISLKPLHRLQSSPRFVLYLLSQLTMIWKLIKWTWSARI